MENPQVADGKKQPGCSRGQHKPVPILNDGKHAGFVCTECGEVFGHTIKFIFEGLIFKDN